MTSEAVSWQASWGVRKYAAEDVDWLRSWLGHEPDGAELAAHGVEPYEDNLVGGNLVTNAGLTRITSLITAGGGQGLSHTATRIGAGNGVGTAAIGDTDLSAASGSTNRYFQPADTSFPAVALGVITVRATFGSGDGNFAWNEFGIDIGTPTVTGGSTVNATLLNHKTSITQGTKVAGQTWVTTAAITLA